MPGSPPTTPRLAIPRYASLDTFNYPLHMNAVSDRVDLMAEKVAQLVTVDALPTGIADGHIISFQTADMAMHRVRWLLRFRSAIGRWECLSTAWLSAGTDASTTLAVDDVWTDPSGGLDCQITVPVRGLYEVMMRVGIIFPSTWTWTEFAVGLAAPSTSPPVDRILYKSIYQTVNAGYYVRLGGKIHASDLLGGNPYGQRYRRIAYDETTRNFQIMNRRMSIRLIRTN